MEFKVGQKIVALKTDNAPTVTGGVVEGSIYTAIRTRPASCPCVAFLVDVGATVTYPDGSQFGLITCETCGKRDIPIMETRWYGNPRFAPIEFDISELTNILHLQETIFQTRESKHHEAKH